MKTFRAFFLILTLTATFALSASATPPAQPMTLKPIKVTLPNNSELFPRGAGADSANANCLICHSVDMVTRQPPSLTQHDWDAIVHKMKAGYGAPIADDQMAIVINYLTATFSRPPTASK